MKNTSKPDFLVIESSAALQLRPRRLDEIMVRTPIRVDMLSEALENTNGSLNELDGPTDEFVCDEITNICEQHPEYPGARFAQALASGNKMTLKMVKALATNPAPTVEPLPQPELVQSRLDLPKVFGFSLRSGFLPFAREAEPEPKMESKAENICKTISKQVIGNYFYFLDHP